MAATNGGLTTSIRRKLQEGKTPEEIVQELVAGGLGQTSAQRFVDRALAEDASAAPSQTPPPMPDTADAPAQGDALDQFIQTKTAETQAAEEKTGRGTLWVGSMLMCGGILITAVSYIMADAGERYTLMWGPVAFGFIIWGQSVLKGFANVRTFAWFSAVASIIVPVVLTVIMLGVAAAYEPTEEELMRMQIAEMMQEANADGAGAQTVANRDELPEVFRLLSQFEESESTTVQCDAARKLARMTGDEAVDAVDGLMEHYEYADELVQACIRDTVSKLDPQVKFPAR
jgi:hypothetical protein